MSIDLMGLNRLLSAVQPTKRLSQLNEYRNGLCRIGSQGAGLYGSKLNGKSDSAASMDIKGLIRELGAIDQQIQQASYEEQSRKLEEERWRQEEAAEKRLREREKLLARHEGVLQNASTRKLLSAAVKFSTYRMAPGATFDVVSRPDLSEIHRGEQGQHSQAGRGEEINREVKSSIEFGIAAAEVARRRKQEEYKEEMQAAAHKEEVTHLPSGKKKRKKASVNIIL